MVLKQNTALPVANHQFESDVISDGTQTRQYNMDKKYLFESDVISDGTQTQYTSTKNTTLFESDVISDGTQTQNAWP